MLLQTSSNIPMEVSQKREINGFPQAGWMNTLKKYTQERLEMCSDGENR